MKEVLNEEYWLNKGVIFINNEINNVTAIDAAQKMIYLANQDFDVVTLIINSPGGSVTDGFYIVDIAELLKKRGITVRTVCAGLSASMGAFLFAAGTKGKRYCLANSEIMIHSVLAGMQGSTSDLKIQFENVFRAKSKYENLLASYCGKTKEEVEAATDRDHYLDPTEAIQFGLADEIVGCLTDILEV